MSKRMGVVLAGAAVLLLSAGSASAQGVCVTVGSACNHYFFVLGATKAPDLYAMNGFEYGCSQSRTRHASGVLRVLADRIEVEFTGTNRQFDFTQAVSWSGEVAKPSLTGDYSVLYTYLSGGVLTAHGASGAMTVGACAEPARPAANEKDTSQP